MDHYYGIIYLLIKIKRMDLVARVRDRVRDR